MEEKAVKERRIISPKEREIRKAVGLVGLIATGLSLYFSPS